MCHQGPSTDIAKVTLHVLRLLVVFLVFLHVTMQAASRGNMGREIGTQALEPLNAHFVWVSTTVETQTVHGKTQY